MTEEAFEKFKQIDFYKNINTENKSNYINNIRIGNETKSLLEQNFVNSICAKIMCSSESNSIGIDFKMSTDGDGQSIYSNIPSGEINKTGNTSTNDNTYSALNNEEKDAIDQVYSLIKEIGDYDERKAAFEEFITYLGNQ